MGYLTIRCFIASVFVNSISALTFLIQIYMYSWLRIPKYRHRRVVSFFTILHFLYPENSFISLRKIVILMIRNRFLPRFKSPSAAAAKPRLLFCYWLLVHYGLCYVVFRLHSCIISLIWHSLNSVSIPIGLRVVFLHGACSCQINVRLPSSSLRLICQRWIWQSITGSYTGRTIARARHYSFICF